MPGREYTVEIRGKDKKFTSIISARKYAVKYFIDHPYANIAIPIWGADEVVAVAKTNEKRPRKVIIDVVSKRNGTKVFKIDKNGTMTETKEILRYIW